MSPLRAATRRTAAAPPRGARAGRGRRQVRDHPRDARAAHVCAHRCGGAARVRRRPARDSPAGSQPVRRHRTANGMADSVPPARGGSLRGPRGDRRWTLRGGLRGSLVIERVFGPAFDRTGRGVALLAVLHAQPSVRQTSRWQSPGGGHHRCVRLSGPAPRALAAAIGFSRARRANLPRPAQTSRHRTKRR